MSRSRAPDDPEPSSKPEPPPSARRWIAPIGIAVALAVAGIIALAVVPVGQSSPIGFTIVTPANTTTPVTHDVSFSRTGVLVFSWSSSNAYSFTLGIKYNHTKVVWTHLVQSSGSASVDINETGVYEFSVVDFYASTISFQGHLHWNAPVL